MSNYPRIITIVALLCVTVPSYACVVDEDCNDNINCTDDTCVGENCVFTANDANCPDDGQYCNGTEYCDSVNDCSSTGDPCQPDEYCNDTIDACLECQISAECDDDVDCTNDACIDGFCQYLPDDGNCPDDGQYCNGLEFCDAVNDCSSTGDPCQAGEFCNEATETCDECQVDGDCNDGVGCTDDTCESGACVFTAHDANCPDDGQYCNGTEYCDAVNDCSSTGDPCQPGEFCNETLDACFECQVGLDCDDGVGCTDNTCVSGFCEYTTNDANCADDGQYCNGTEYCDAVSDCSSTGDPCQAGEFCNETADTCDECQVDGDCDDGVGCTDDTCESGVCVFAANDANCAEDGQYCNGTEFCDAVNDCSSTGDPCQAGEFCNETADTCDECQVDGDCDDGVGCTDDTCESGACVFLPNGALCNDGVDCTDDACDPVLDCQFTPNDANCSDGVGCTDDLCDPVDGCQNAANDGNCDDGVGCTDDVCDPVNDCQNTPNDGNCDDGIGCTDDTCDVTLDCRFTPNHGLCNDDVECTVDTCHPVTGCGFTPDPGSCHDGNECTDDVCDPVNGDPTTGCLNPTLPDETPCTDDRIECTRDVCIGGACNTLDHSACDDQNECTGNYCSPALGDPVTGCLNPAVVNYTPCTDDGITCTNDVCINGTCTPVLVDSACADLNDCTEDVCDPAIGDPVTGCLNPPSAVGTACAGDGLYCTVDQCDGEGSCISTPSNDNCNDGNECTNNLCDPGDPEADPTTGCRYPPVAYGTPCTPDWFYCTWDVCNYDGVCAHIPDHSLCDDDNECTEDTCYRVSGCQNVPLPVGTPCNDDGFACTDDTCQYGTCVHWPFDERCDDSNPCTADVCDLETGCQNPFDPADTDCDDGVFCNGTDACDGQGVCVNSGPPCGACVCDTAADCMVGDCVDNICVDVTGCGCDQPLVEAVGGRYLAITPLPAVSTELVRLLVSSPDFPCLSKYVGGPYRCDGVGEKCSSDAQCNACSETGDACLIDEDCFFFPQGETCIVSGQQCQPGGVEPIDLNGDGLPDGTLGMLVNDPVYAAKMTPAGWGTSLKRCSRSIGPCETDADCRHGVCVHDGCDPESCDTPCSVFNQDCARFCSISAFSCITDADCDVPGETCVIPICVRDETCVLGKVYVTGPDIVPSNRIGGDLVPTVYQVVAECDVATDAVAAEMWLWCDVNHDHYSNFNDVMMKVLAFQGYYIRGSGVPSTLAGVDSVGASPCWTEQVPNFGDVQAAVFAFQGETYMDRLDAGTCLGNGARCSVSAQNCTDGSTCDAGHDCTMPCPP